MKKKMDFLLIISIVVIALVFVGCTGKNESNSSVVSGGNVQLAQAGGNSQNKTITVETIDHYRGTFIFLLHATQEEVPLMTDDVTISSGEVDIVQCTGSGVDTDGITKSRWSVRYTSSANVLTFDIKKNGFTFVPNSFEFELD